MSSKFSPSISTTLKMNSNDLAFVFYNNNKILLRDKKIPKIEDLEKNYRKEGTFFGSIGKQKCFVFNYNSTYMNMDAKESDLYLLRSILSLFENAIIQAACYSSHLLYWHKRSKYCGKCGSLTTWSTSELAKVCAKCKEIYYPKISPAVIVAITKEDRLLLAHNKNFKDGFYSVLAGFVEIGESIEQAAIREVKEEVGIEIKNIRYFYSQPWPFVDSLMIGLTADYKSGTIRPDKKEIIDAAWYKRDEFPLTPGKETIAGKLIENFKKTNRP